MAITTIEKELAAVAISVAAGCRPCFSYHFKEARKAGASDQEIGSAALEGTHVRRSAADVMVHFADSHLKTSKQDGQQLHEIEGDRGQLLIAIGAAFAVNCVTSLEKYFDTAEELAIPKEDIETILELSKMVKGRAAHHVERWSKTRIHVSRIA